MYRTIAFFIICCACLLIALASDPGRTAADQDETGSLVEHVKTIAAQQPKEGSEGFSVPTLEQQNAFRKMITAVLDGQIDKANAIARRESFNYRVVPFKDEKTQRQLLLIEENPLKHGWGFFVIDPGSRSPLVIEVPHPVSDENTEIQGAEAFLLTGARAFILAGTHRRANGKLSKCTQATEQSRYAESDVAHNTQTMFHQAHEVLFGEVPDSVVVQLHGMREREVCPDVFLSGGFKSVSTNSSKLLKCLKTQNIDSVLFGETESSCPLIASTNVQGRFSNGMGARACTEYAVELPQPGRFIHVEQEPEIRANSAAWRPVIEALKCAFPANPPGGN
ncbi:MAG: hypothetical protein DWQ47_12420 [Acidobacteria bacterium]|nr:MAG: hypothetical protein DWQ32_14835 [Acidobacteriota bacterium]REJ98373.1 MAG: hypothetical protein DWQ38_17635 [Acidobacteriota bacterium]REK17117.1 MAG: hypothetical protein DWQ43_02680 [Acidobacteriota bacterium]REK43027.1 MAG: hypothetical protein DWQ47_12420 [Acidobacteriota bacterium]